MAETYKHSYKSGEILMTSLSVYNTGYQRCEAGYQWGPGVRDHYCIHHILSGTGYYTVGEKTWKLEAGDTFILYPGVEVKYYADQQEPWEYAWAGFMGTDAASIIRNTGFLKERPFLKRGNVPDNQIRNGLEQIYNAKGNGYEEAVAMTGALYSLLSVFMHYHEGEDQERDAKLLYVEKAENYIETNYSCRLCRNQQKSSVPLFSDLYELFAKRISDRIQNPAGLPSVKRDGAVGFGDCIFCWF